MTTQSLRQKILELAIQGKLVEQRPEEGTADELYAQIQAEKQKLIKAGKLKKEKPLPEITDSEKPFDIPKGWKWVRLGDCSTYAQSKEKISKSKITADLWSLDLEDVEKETGRIIERRLAGDRNITGEKVLFRKGQVLYSKLRPYLKKVLVAPDDGICSPEMVPFSLYANIRSQYFVYVLTSPYVDSIVNSVSYGVKMPRVGTETMVNLPIPLPPLAEQKRIVAKVEALLHEVDVIENAQTAMKVTVEQMKRKLLELAVRGELVFRRGAETQRLGGAASCRAEKDTPFNIPSTWRWVKLGELCSKVGAGKTPRGGKTIYVSSGIPFLREQNIHNDGLRLDDVAYITDAINSQMRGSQIKPMDLLMNITGGSIGRTALVPDEFSAGNINQHILILRLINPEYRHYLLHVLHSPYALDLMFSRQTGDKPGLSAEKVKNFLIPLPPLAEQKRIVAKLDELLSALDSINQNLCVSAPLRKTK